MGSRNQEVSIKHSRDSERVRITRIAIRVDPMFLESFVPLLSHYPSIALKPLKPIFLVTIGAAHALAVVGPCI